MNISFIGPLLLQVALIALNAVFACTEIAVISMNDVKLAKMAERGDKNARRLVQLTSQPARFLSTIQVAITLSGFLGSAFAADNFSDSIVAWLVGLGVPIPVATLDTLAVVGVTLILSYFTLVFGELVPKRLAQKKAEPLALGLAGMITCISKAFSPIVTLLTFSTNGILRLLGIDPDSEDENVSEEEIRMMVDVGSEKGVIDDHEKTMIQNIFEFDDMPVSAFATHRTDLCILRMQDGIEGWDEIIRQSRYSRYPICGRNIDEIIGILNVKAYFRMEDRSMEKVLAEAVRTPYFVPDSLRADQLFKRMKENGDHFAVVLDEYGGVSGVVTMKDLLEQIVGNFDEDAAPDDEIPLHRLDNGVFELGGAVLVHDAELALGIDLPDEDHDTMGGLAFGLYGSIPEDGSTFSVEYKNKLRIEVLEICDHRIVRMHIHKL